MQNEMDPSEAPQPLIVDNPNDDYKSLVVCGRVPGFRGSQVDEGPLKFLRTKPPRTDDYIASPVDAGVADAAVSSGLLTGITAADAASVHTDDGFDDSTGVHNADVVPLSDPSDHVMLTDPILSADPSDHVAAPPSTPTTFPPATPGPEEAEEQTLPSVPVNLPEPPPNVFVEGGPGEYTLLPETDVAAARETASAAAAAAAAQVVLNAPQNATVADAVALVAAVADAPMAHNEPVDAAMTILSALYPASDIGNTARTQPGNLPTVRAVEAPPCPFMSNRPTDLSDECLQNTSICFPRYCIQQFIALHKLVDKCYQVLCDVKSALYMRVDPTGATTDVPYVPDSLSVSDSIMGLQTIRAVDGPRTIMDHCSGAMPVGARTEVTESLPPDVDGSHEEPLPFRWDSNQKFPSRPQRSKDIEQLSNGIQQHVERARDGPVADTTNSASRPSVSVAAPADIDARSFKWKHGFDQPIPVEKFRLVMNDLVVEAITGRYCNYPASKASLVHCPLCEFVHCRICLQHFSILPICDPCFHQTIMVPQLYKGDLLDQDDLPIDDAYNQYPWRMATHPVRRRRSNLDEFRTPSDLVVTDGLQLPQTSKPSLWEKQTNRVPHVINWDNRICVYRFADLKKFNFNMFTAYQGLPSHMPDGNVWTPDKVIWHEDALKWFDWFLALLKHNSQIWSQAGYRRMDNLLCTFRSKALLC